MSGAIDFGARQLLTGPVSAGLAGEPPCAVCARPSGGRPIGAVVSNNFTTWDLVRGGQTAPCCDACTAAFGDFAYRNKVLLADAAGISPADAATVRARIEAGPFPFVLTFPMSRQKHCWLHAGMSDTDTLRVGGDDRTIEMPTRSAREALVLIDDLFRVGATKTEVKIGIYRPATIQPLAHEFERIERFLAPIRACGGLDVLTWCCERPQGVRKGDAAMLDDDDRLAADLLARLANGSALRDNDPIGFWGRGYLSRLSRRIGSPDLKTFVELMAAEIAIRTVSLRDTVIWIERLPPGAEARILERIKRSPRVLVAMAQDAAKGLRDRPRDRPVPPLAADQLNDLVGGA